MDNNKPVTKNDLKKELIEFGTKFEAKFATKEDLKKELAKFVTKKDFKKELAKFATKKDLNELEQKIDTRFKDQVIFVRQEINNTIDDKLGQWKSELFDIVDGLAVEIRDGREHREITSHQIIENQERIGKLEYKVFGSVASF